jgi:hypothetical protein
MALEEFSEIIDRLTKLGLEIFIDSAGYVTPSRYDIDYLPIDDIRISHDFAIIKLPQNIQKELRASMPLGRVDIKLKDISANHYVRLERADYKNRFTTSRSCYPFIDSNASDEDKKRFNEFYQAVLSVASPFNYRDGCETCCQNR